MDSSSHGKAPPYVTFRLLDDFLESLSSEKPFPSVLDLTFPAMEIDKNKQRLLFRALYFFAFIDQGGVTTTNLKDYIQASPREKKDQWKSLLYDYYGTEVVTEMRENNRAPARAYFAKQGLSERLQERCISFLIRAIQRAGWEVRPVPRARQSQALLPKKEVPPAPLTSSTEPIYTYLTLGVRRTCVLTHDFELSKSDVEKIKQLLDVIIGSDQIEDGPEIHGPRRTKALEKFGL